jgi:type II secretory pathway predicted ATPase ExeA
LDSVLDVYVAHFGLTERPFSLVPDPAFLFWSTHHRRAFAMLDYGILTRAPITLITGEVGAGKTTLLHELLSQLPASMRVALVTNSHGDRGELLRWVLLALDQPAPSQTGYVELFRQFQDFLIAEYAAGRNVVLIFDEAQNLSREALEELRMFTNINSNKDVLLQIVLVGQPELRDTIRRPDMAQLAQRVASSFHIPALAPEGVREYVHHRLAVAGATSLIFTSDALDIIARETRGIPRLINQLCDFSMVYAFSKDERHVSSRTVGEVLADGVFFAGGHHDAPPEPEISVAAGER